jgi:T4 superinfection immunity protein
MSTEWLQKLAELSNDKGLVARARRAQQATARNAPGQQPRRGLVGALVAFFFRLVVILAAFEAAVMFAVANSAGITQESLGYIFHYAIWSGLVEGLGEVGLYEATVRPALEQLGDAAPFLAPLAGALAATIYLLPSINAARLRNPIRVFVYIINLAFGWSLFGWIIALAISLITGFGRAAPATTAPARPSTASPHRRAPAVVSAPSTAAAVRTAARVPTVVRSGGHAASWIRPR